MSVLSKGRLFGLTTFDWTVLLGSSSLCGLLRCFSDPTPWASGRGVVDIYGGAP